MEITKQTKLINTEDGEVLYTEEKDMEFYLFTEKGYMLHNNKPFVKLLNVEWPVSKMDRSKLLDLATYMNKSNALMRKDRPQHPLTIPLIAEIIELSSNRTYPWMKRLIDSGVMKKDDGFFYVNPLYMVAANRLSPELYRIFEKELTDHIPDWVKSKYKEMGKDHG